MPNDPARVDRVREACAKRARLGSVLRDAVVALGLLGAAQTWAEAAGGTAARATPTTRSHS